jgi:hypothetical protein
MPSSIRARARERASQYRRLAHKVRAASRIIANVEKQRALIDVAECYELLAAEAGQARHASAAHH